MTGHGDGLGGIFRRLPRLFELDFSSKASRHVYLATSSGDPHRSAVPGEASVRDWMSSEADRSRVGGGGDNKIKAASPATAQVFVCTSNFRETGRGRNETPAEETAD